MTSNEEARPFDTMTTAAPMGDNTRSRQEQEEQLILTAWQSMSSALQKHTLFKDSRNPGPAQSFLSKQRQSTQARRALFPRLQPR
ncbi:protein Hook homolog 2-like [Micropterus salmoides]|uniref:protein Hook homolog 2-like n=1 Tax=Micropterus salmoides TaxID=27706 RepID=UPI0018EA3A63|nr:protein Hook homolog 2-like [Micropterus salmoides]